MNIDIVEALRLRDDREIKYISIDNGKVVVRPGVPPRLGPEEEVEPSEIVPLDD